jgi:hypothetical protein
LRCLLFKRPSRRERRAGQRQRPADGANAQCETYRAGRLAFGRERRNRLAARRRRSLCPRRGPACSRPAPLPPTETNALRRNSFFYTSRSWQPDNLHGVCRDQSLLQPSVRLAQHAARRPLRLVPRSPGLEELLAVRSGAGARRLASSESNTRLIEQLRHGCCRGLKPALRPHGRVGSERDLGGGGVFLPAGATGAYQQSWQCCSCATQ